MNCHTSQARVSHALRIFVASIFTGLAMIPLSGCQDRSVEVRVEGGMDFKDTVVGRGIGADEGNEVLVHYEARLPDGTVIISTREKDRPHRFTIGDGTVILGMNEAVKGMKAGGVRTVTIPPRMHYGTRGYADKIPPKTSLDFTIEMIRVGS